MPSTTNSGQHSGPGRFEATRWSIIVAAGGADSERARKGLAHLCSAYWYPIYAFIRRQGHAPHDAQDLTQEFFARLLARNFLCSADPGKGRFRSFLLGVLKHFLSGEWDRARAQKRGGGQQLVSLDAESAETRYQLEPAGEASAEQIFERRWALALLDQVLTRLRGEMSAAGKLAELEALKSSLSGEKRPYADIARELNISEGAVKVAVHRLRHRYRDLIRAEIAETVATPGEVEDELRHLLAALST